MPKHRTNNSSYFIQLPPTHPTYFRPISTNLGSVTLCHNRSPSKNSNFMENTAFGQRREGKERKESKLWAKESLLLFSYGKGTRSQDVGYDWVLVSEPETRTGNG